MGISIAITQTFDGERSGFFISINFIIQSLYL